MQSDAHLTAAMLAVVDALRGGIDEAQRQLDRTQRIQRATTDMPGLTLRQRGLTDVYIGLLLGGVAPATVNTHVGCTAGRKPEWCRPRTRPQRGH